MRKLNLLITLSLLLSITACEDEVATCKDTFQSDYKSLMQSFSDVYNPKTTVEEFNQFKNKITAFQEKYPEKCALNDEIYEHNKELDKFLAMVNQKTVITPKVIYGKDDRLDIADSTDARHQQWAKSVAVQVSSAKIGAGGELNSTTIADNMYLCEDEPFADQINPGRCSGFLVGENILVTAGHCVESQSDCSNYKWVFGFKKGVSKLSDDQIYSCKSIISQQLSSSTKADFAVLELDRAVVDAAPLTYRASGSVSVGDPITVMGHPSGLPMKVAPGANIRTNSNDWYFVANLDTFGGNSGSPVFNSDTGIVEGILVRGETDYTWKTDSSGNSCRVSFQCADDSCRGEDVTRITKVTGLPKQETPKEVLASFFPNSTLPIDAKGISFKVQVKNGPTKYLAGTKFLEACALHTAENSDPRNWLDSIVANCERDQVQLLQIVETFKD
ncbi:trypsin-like serine peptidase [Halobacteriovorax marinus]|uniref:trypsin-like serine peptidase n=1 Tax=Halobacteriovorax marinus TaxID=97084 RepID=UPI003A8F3D10